ECIDRPSNGTVRSGPAVADHVDGDAGTRWILSGNRFHSRGTREFDLGNHDDVGNGPVEYSSGEIPLCGHDVRNGGGIECNGHDLFDENDPGATRRRNRNDVVSDSAPFPTGHWYRRDTDGAICRG